MAETTSHSIIGGVSLPTLVGWAAMILAAGSMLATMRTNLENMKEEADRQDRHMESIDTSVATMQIKLAGMRAELDVLSLSRSQIPSNRREETEEDDRGSQRDDFREHRPTH